MNSVKGNSVGYVSTCHDIKTLIRDNKEYTTFPELSMAAWLDAKENKKSVEGDFGPSLKEYNPDISIEELI